MSLKLRRGENSRVAESMELPSRPDAGARLPARLHWMMTELCPYSCAYCYVPRHKLAQVGETPNHAFRNFPVQAWLDGFVRHFAERRLALVISGGEPMADRASIISLLNGLRALSFVECIQINTSAYWDARRFAGLDRSKLILNCSFHPEQTDVEEYFERIGQIVRAGFRVGIVNYVIFGARRERYPEYKARLRDLGVPINPNPDMHSVPDAAERSFFSAALPALDFKYKVLRASPCGQPCWYSSIAYEMDFAGSVHVGCLPSLSGIFFDATLPQPPVGSIPCPHNTCGCRDRYAMLLEASAERRAAVDHLAYYSRELLAIQAREGLLKSQSPASR